MKNAYRASAHALILNHAMNEDKQDICFMQSMVAFKSSSTVCLNQDLRVVICASTYALLQNSMMI